MQGISVAVGVLCPDCGSVFPNKRGLAVHRSAHHPEQVNAERLREEDRRAAGATKPPPLTRPRNSGWTEDEDQTFIRRYLEFKSTGRAMGFIDAPELPAPILHHLAWRRLPRVDPQHLDWTSPWRDMTPPGHLDWTTPRMDMTPPAILDEISLRQQTSASEHPDLTTPRWDMTPPGHLDETTTPDVTFPQWDMTPVGNPIMAKAPWAMTPRSSLANRLKELAAQEGDLQVQLDELVEELQAAMVATQPAGEPHIRAF
ncbi:hypothetical protein J6590_102063 [Homalodisca vitripennis]|nr:hypothetical protein J6590_023353 [Homalodisca vitripennis]KAG8299398.1 hypothetical protein J6590_102063 [Homalodisca vitripennis]